MNKNFKMILRSFLPISQPAFSLVKGVAALALVAGSASAFAAPIPVAGVTASSTFYTYNVNNLINGSGLTGNLHSGNWQNKWLTNGTVTGSLIFDLGSVFDIATTSIWNYGPGCCGDGRSVKNMDIEESTDGVNFFEVGNYTLGEPFSDPFPADTLSLNIVARYVKFDLNSNYGDSYTGLSEVQFSGAAQVVPEPAILATFALGLLGIAAFRRRNQQ